MGSVKARSEKRMMIKKKVDFKPTEKNKKRIARMNGSNHINDKSLYNL